MIRVQNCEFHLETKNTAYLFDTTPTGHLRHLHYGAKVLSADDKALSVKNTIQLGSSVHVAPGECLDDLLLDYSGIGRGDYRHTPLECRMPDGSFVADFVYDYFTVEETPVTIPGLPSATGKGETLSVWLKDPKFPV